MTSGHPDGGPCGGLNDDAGVHVGLSDDDSSGEEAKIRRTEEMMTEVLATMRPVQPGIIRAVHAGRALWCCGRAFRQKPPRSFHASFPTSQILYPPWEFFFFNIKPKRV